MERENDIFRYYSSLYQQSTGNVSLDTDFYNNPSGIESSLNPRQIFWIRKRKLRRDMLDSLVKSNGSNYIHESRHRHAMKRMRAPSGRFLTKEEMNEALQKAEK